MLITDCLSFMYPSKRNVSFLFMFQVSSMRPPVLCKRLRHYYIIFKALILFLRTKVKTICCRKIQNRNYGSMSSLKRIFIIISWIFTRQFDNFPFMLVHLITNQNWNERRHCQHSQKVQKTIFKYSWC